MQLSADLHTQLVQAGAPWHHSIIVYHLHTSSLILILPLFSSSGVAGISPILGHSIGTLSLYKILCKMQKHLGGLGACSLSIQWVYKTCNFVDIHSDTAPFDFKTV